MTMFQQLRIWLHRASTAERTTTGLAVIIVVALLSYLIVPVTGGSATAALQANSGFPTPTGANTPTGPGVAASPGAIATPGTIGGTTGGPQPTGPSSAVGGGNPSFPGGTTGGPASGGSTRQCTSAAAGQGVTATELKLAVTIVNLVGAVGNGAVGVPSPAEQEKDYGEVADTINKAGGAACRKLVLTFYTVNPLDPSNTQSQCQAIADSKPFAALDLGALTDVGASDCIPQQKIPLISQFVSKDQAKAYYPYYINPLSLSEDNYHNGYLGASQKGYFNAASGFKKLGIIYQKCRPSVVAAGRDALRNAGIPDSATVTYNMGCPPERQNTAADFQQAVLNFQQAGVTHVTEIDSSGWAGFTQAAAQQKFKPKYVFAEDAAANDFSGSQAPDPANFDGAVNVIGRRLGEAKTPGFKPSAGTARCNNIYAAHGQKPVYQQGAGYGGVVCNLLWFVVGVVEHSSVLQRNMIVGSMHMVGSIDNSYPWGPVDFSSFPAGTPYGRESWRIDQFHASNASWQVQDPTFHPPFA